MIHKYWNVRLNQGQPGEQAQIMSEEDATDEMRKAVRDGEEKVEDKVLWIWRTLSSFEEKSATCISDMLLHVSNGAYMDGVVAAKKFITHVDLLFAAADDLDWLLLSKTTKGLSYSREAKLLCKKVVAFFQLLAESQETGVRRLGVTQELLSLVTGLAHYLKLLIRICLQGALKLEREAGTPEGLNRFLQDIGKLDERLESEDARDSRGETDSFIARSADSCGVCEKPVEDRCFKRQDRLVHAQCLTCARCNRFLSEDASEARWSETQRKVFCDKHAGSASSGDNAGFVEVTRLQQYVYLLRVAHARLLATLRTSGALPHTSGLYTLETHASHESLTCLQMIQIFRTMIPIKDTESPRTAPWGHPYCKPTRDPSRMQDHQGASNHPHHTSRPWETSEDFGPRAWKGIFPLRTERHGLLELSMVQKVCSPAQLTDPNGGEQVRFKSSKSGTRTASRSPSSVSATMNP